MHVDRQTARHTHHYTLLPYQVQSETRDLALASMARDDPPASSTTAASSTVSSMAAVLLQHGRRRNAR